jgi:hypothetical protein
MIGEKTRFAQEVAQVEQWWKVIYLFDVTGVYNNELPCFRTLALHK